MMLPSRRWNSEYGVDCNRLLNIGVLDSGSCETDVPVLAVVAVACPPPLLTSSDHFQLRALPPNAELSDRPPAVLLERAGPPMDTWKWMEAQQHHS